MKKLNDGLDCIRGCMVAFPFCLVFWIMVVILIYYFMRN